jgi:hypothetical protein
MPSLLRSLVAESVDLVRSSAKMTLITILLGLVIMLIPGFLHQVFRFWS